MTERRMMYPGNDPECGPAEWHVRRADGGWTSERELRQARAAQHRLRLRPDWALLRDIPDAVRDGCDVDFEMFMVANGDAYNLCEEFDEDGCPTPRGLRRAQAFVQRARNWTPLAWQLYGWCAAARVAAAVVRCALLGHRWVDNSYGGPDGGCVSAHCSRCGYGHHHVLY